MTDPQPVIYVDPAGPLVHVRFSVELSWFVLTPSQALELAAKLVDVAGKVESHDPRV